MQNLADLDIDDLPMATEEFAEDPYSFVEKARARHPWLARCENGYCVIDYLAMRELMRMDDKMRPPYDAIVAIMGAKGSPWGRYTEEQMFTLPDHEHKLLRDTFMRLFTPRFANRLRPVMRATMNRLLDEWGPREIIDFEEFISYYPVSVLSNLVGGPVEAIPHLRNSLEIFGLGMSLNPDLVPALDKAYIEIEAFCEGLIAKRKEADVNEQAESLLDVMIKAGSEGNISARKLTDLLIFLYVAGYDTSKNVMTMMMKVMTKHPEIYARCAQDLDYCADCVEEMLRYYNPSTSNRLTTADVVYRDVLIPKDTMLFLPLSISGRDPMVFDDPHRFFPERATNDGRAQIAFGLGKHMCLGQHIARAQMQEGLHLIAQRMLAPQINGTLGWRPFYGIWGHRAMPIRYKYRDPQVEAV